MLPQPKYCADSTGYNNNHHRWRYVASRSDTSHLPYIKELYNENYVDRQARFSKSSPLIYVYYCMRIPCQWQYCLAQIEEFGFTLSFRHSEQSWRSGLFHLDYIVKIPQVVQESNVRGITFHQLINIYYMKLSSASARNSFHHIVVRYWITLICFVLYYPVSRNCLPFTLSPFMMNKAYSSILLRATLPFWEWRQSALFSLAVRVSCTRCPFRK